METFQDAVTQLSSAEAGGFDLSPQQLEGLVNEGVARLASRSLWVKAELELGPTNLEGPGFALDSNVVKLIALAIDLVPYGRVDLRTIWDLQTGTRTFNPTDGIGGVYAERFSDDGFTKLFSVWPVPTVGGLKVTGLAAITPRTLTAEDPLPFPVEYRRAVVDYAKGILYEDIDENPQSGTYFLERADALAEQLRLEANSLTGSSPFQIPVMGLRGRRH